MRACGRRRRAFSANRWDRTTREQRREIKFDFVDKTGVEGLAEHVSATFKQYTRDLSTTEIGQDAFERPPTVNQSALGETVGK